MNLDVDSTAGLVIVHTDWLLLGSTCLSEGSPDTASQRKKHEFLFY